MTIRTALVALHRALVEAERREHEKTLGRLSGGEFLQALISDPVFSWLTPLTTLIVRLDELDDATDAERTAVLAAARALLSGTEDSEFRRRCAALVQQSPDVAFAYGAAKTALR
ncbi:MAG: hypothetical protein E6H54_14240 [Betaproteobacteria bacterium]|nr:MAG: hypothetical protein E6H54_14240 [Betaproteobacteria bacterium]